MLLKKLAAISLEFASPQYENNKLKWKYLEAVKYILSGDDKLAEKVLDDALSEFPAYKVYL